jgi:16S rRNA (uracil1498-N3)-methyltransferase
VTRPRFFAPDLEPATGEAVLSADESHHLVSVLRLGTGDEVSVFDGAGHEFRARVTRADRKRTVLALVEPVPLLPDSAVPVVLIQAVLKGDKMDGVVRDATMAGVSRIVPVLTDRSLVSIATLARAHAVERWQRVAIASAKQCRRATLPAVEPPRPFEDWLGQPCEGLRLLFAEPSDDVQQPRSIRQALDGDSPSAVSCIVGPEGGWAVPEREAAVAAGCLLVTLGRMTLRADAAGLVAVSIVRFALADL